jgi:3-dehydroquinate dehydratase
VEAGAAGIDMQGYTFDLPSRDGFVGENLYSFTKSNPKEVVTDPVIIAKQCEFIEKVHEKGAEVLLSCHPGIVMDSTQVVELALFMEKRNPDIIKIVTAATNEDEMLESIKAMLMLKKEVKTPVSYHANGKAGALSRILNPVLGGQIAFCIDHYNEGSTMEQIDLKTTRAVVDHMRKLI